MPVLAGGTSKVMLVPPPAPGSGSFVTVERRVPQVLTVTGLEVGTHALVPVRLAERAVEALERRVLQNERLTSRQNFLALDAGLLRCRDSHYLAFRCGVE